MTKCYKTMDELLRYHNNPDSDLDRYLNHIEDIVKQYQTGIEEKIDDHSRLNSLVELLNQEEWENKCNPQASHEYQMFYRKWNEMISFREIDFNAYELIITIKYIIDNCFSDNLKSDPRSITRLVRDVKPFERNKQVKYTHFQVFYTNKSQMRELSQAYYAYYFVNNVFPSYNPGTIDEFNFIYENFVPVNYQNNFDFINKVCYYAPKLIAYIYERINDDTYINKFIEDNQSHIKLSELPNQIKKNAGAKACADTYIMRNIDLIMTKNNSNLPEILKKRYFSQYQKKHNNDDNIVTFLYTMFNSNVLENLFKEPIYTENDINFVRAFLTMLDTDALVIGAYDTNRIHDNFEKFRRKYADLAIKVFNSFMAAKNDDDKMRVLLFDLKITKENAFNFVKGQKFWSSKQKQAIIVILDAYYGLNTIMRVCDVLTMLDEMAEKELTKDQMLKIYNIDKKYFDKVYSQLEITNPELHKVMQDAFRENSYIGFEKHMKLYFSIKTYDFSDRDSFIKKYKKLPEEVLNDFKNNPKHYNELYKILKDIIDDDVMKLTFKND